MVRNLHRRVTGDALRSILGHGPVTPGRIDAWVRANIHVQGRPEWRFIKIHTHGATIKADADEILGPEMDAALAYLERNYSDGTNYLLHYVTAREAFNVARAAADGKDGDPMQYSNYLIPPYAANHVSAGGPTIDPLFSKP